ncbi:MAG TPA: hypothetical protein VFE65_23795 [Pseudonocardia sp.]|nr:hypothetical protein [Pseudonocardia sp.]
MSAQRKRRQAKTHKHPHRDRGPRSGAMFHSRCVRVGEAFHALIRLPAPQAVAVRPGQSAQITSHALPGVSLPGQVLTVDPTTSARYLVTVAVTGTHEGLRHGLPIDVSITTYTKTDVLVVPNTAVIRSGGDFFVDVLEPDGHRRRVQFTPGLIGHATTEVVHGLTDGQEVVLSTPESG